MVAIARDVVLTTPSVALASDSTRLACRSPSNRPLTKRLTPGKPRVRSGVIDRPADRVACGESHRSRGCGNRFMSGGRLRIRSARHESFQKAGTPLLILLLCARVRDDMRGCMRRQGWTGGLMTALAMTVRPVCTARATGHFLS